MVVRGAAESARPDVGAVAAAIERDESVRPADAGNRPAAEIDRAAEQGEVADDHDVAVRHRGDGAAHVVAAAADRSRPLRLSVSCVECGDEAVGQSIGSQSSAADFRLAVEIARHEEASVRVDREAAHLICRGLSESPRPQMFALRVVAGQEDVVRTGAGQRAAAEVHALLETPGDDHVAVGRDRHRGSDVRRLTAERVYPAQRPVFAGVRSQEDVALPVAGHLRAAEASGAGELSRYVDVARRVDRDARGVVLTGAAELDRPEDRAPGIELGNEDVAGTNAAQRRRAGVESGSELPDDDDVVRRIRGDRLAGVVAGRVAEEKRPFMVLCPRFRRRPRIHTAKAAAPNQPCLNPLLPLPMTDPRPYRRNACVDAPRKLLKVLPNGHRARMKPRSAIGPDSEGEIEEWRKAQHLLGYGDVYATLIVKNSTPFSKRI